METESVKSLFLPKTILALDDLVKQAEAIANLGTNSNLESSYKHMPIENHITNVDQERCKRHAYSKKKRVNTTA